MPASSYEVNPAPCEADEAARVRCRVCGLLLRCPCGYSAMTYHDPAVNPSLCLTCGVAAERKAREAS